jgi:hypothetical protein
MTSGRIELRAAASAVLGLSVTLLFTACGDEGGTGDGVTASGGSAGSGGGLAPGSGGNVPSGGGGTVSATGGSPATAGVPGAGGGPTTGGASGGTGTGIGGTGSGGLAPTGGSAGSGTGGSSTTGGSAGSGTGGSSTTGGSAGTGGSGPATDGCAVMPITDDMRSRYQNMTDPYYTKYAATSGGVIVGTGTKVDDAAIVRYCRLLSEMFSNEKVRQPVLSSKMWFTMIDNTEQLSSLPQINKSYGTSLNARARGLGGLTPTICAEDSIMCTPGDPWVNDCICPHETGHTLYSSGIAKNPELSKRLTDITNAARSSGRLANAYVWEDGNESGMMSWGTQAWYNCAINGTKGAYHTDINTREELQKELPEFYQFLSELLPTDNKYKDCYAKP